MVTITFRAMGCQMSAFLDVPSAQAAEALSDIPAWFEDWEQILSRFRTDSELNQLNRSPAESVQVSQVLWDVIQLALEAADQSAGLVTPLVLGALEDAGYDRSFDLLAALSFDERVDDAQIGRPVPGFEGMVLDPFERTVCLPPGMRLDLGGVAKGWAANRAMEYLQEAGPALVNAGGDIAISGQRQDGRLWPVGILDPQRPESNLGTLLLPQSGVATSGIDYRRWQYHDVWQHHIIDPRSGQPARTDVLSTTVIAPTVMAAETAAKIVLISGSQVGMEWLSDHPSLAAMVTRQNGQVDYSDSYRQYQWRLS
jgi:FAD:protein FMN transferase